MINELEIHNFKSIKDLTLPCKRFNLFIGEPNTGKSNILEALGLVSFVGVRQYVPETKLEGFVRHDRLSSLFWDQEVENPLFVRWDGLVLWISYSGRFYQGICQGAYPADPGAEPERLADFTDEDGRIGKLDFYNPCFEGYAGQFTHPSMVKFYKAPEVSSFRGLDISHLLPPNGNNLLSLLTTHRELREAIGLPFFSLDYKLWLRPHENKIDLAKDGDEMVIVSFPYSMASETLQRITFYTAAIETNKNSVIVLEEPETHSFPGETKLLAEQIALDENSNQYFIVTHNPYFLMPLFSKAPKDDIAINIVYCEDYQTKIRPLQGDELSELFELDIFANLARYIEE